MFKLPIKLLLLLLNIILTLCIIFLLNRKEEEKVVNSKKDVIVERNEINQNDNMIIRDENDRVILSYKNGIVRDRRGWVVGRIQYAKF